MQYPHLRSRTVHFSTLLCMLRRSSIILLLCPLLAFGQQDRSAQKHQPWLEFTLGHKLAGGFFGIGGGVELARFAIPNAVFGLGGGPDGATVAIGNEAWLVRYHRMEVRGSVYWNYAFGRDQSDEFSKGYRTVTDPSTSVKLGASFIIHSGADVSFALRTGWSWALDVPTVTEESPSGIRSYPSDDPYFSDGLLLGVGVMARL